MDEEILDVKVNAYVSVDFPKSSDIEGYPLWWAQIPIIGAKLVKCSEIWANSVK